MKISVSFFFLCIFFHWPFLKWVPLTPECFLLGDSWGCHQMFCLEALLYTNTFFRFFQEWHLQLRLFTSIITSSSYMLCMQTVGQNKKNKQKLHKFTPNDIRPGREGGVQDWRLDHGQDGCGSWSEPQTAISMHENHWVSRMWPRMEHLVELC
jgi:hypothetical protein